MVVTCCHIKFLAGITFRTESKTNLSFVKRRIGLGDCAWCFRFVKNQISECLFLFLCSIALKIEEFILHRRGTSENKEFSVPDRKFQILFPPDFATVMIPKKKRWCCVAMALKTRLVISAGLLQRCKRCALCEACRVCFRT